MTTKQYLQQIDHITQRIIRLQKLRDDLREDMYDIQGIDYSKDRIQSTPEGDRMLRMVEKVERIEKETIKEIHDLNCLKQKIIHEIETVPIERYRQLLYDRYVSCMKWSEIAQRLSNTSEPLDIRWVFRLHGSALKSFHDHCMTTTHG